jgi:hypothetical protein
MRISATASVLLLAMCWTGFASTEAQVPDGARKELQKTGAETQAFAGVSAIVFIDKEDACPCTEERIKVSWKALQGVLKDRKDIRVTRVHYDTESKAAEKYVAMRPLMVLPAVYFLNGRGALLEMLQGDVKASQITAVFKKNGPTT